MQVATNCPFLWGRAGPVLSASTQRYKCWNQQQHWLINTTITAFCPSNILTQKMKWSRESLGNYTFWTFDSPILARAVCAERVSPNFSVSGSSDRAARGAQCHWGGGGDGLRAKGSFISSVLPPQTIVGEGPTCQQIFLSRNFETEVI